jgi:hypothetical protein
MNQLLSGLASKLIEIADSCIDMDTQEELYELIDKIVESIN